MPADTPSGAPVLVVCCGMDGASSAAVEALGRLPAASGLRLRSYRSAASPGGGQGAWETLSGEEWRVLDHAEGGWEGLAPVVHDALRPGAGAEVPARVEVVLLCSGADREGPPMLGEDMVSALAALRRRYHLVSTVSLVVLAGFESATRTAPGRLVRLPECPGGLGEAEGLDRVVLLDVVDVRGIPTAAPDEATRIAELIGECTFGELARELLRVENGNRGSLGSRGRFVSVGFASWSLDGEAARNSVAAALAEKLTAAMVADACVQDPAAPGGAASSGWLDRARGELWGESAPAEGPERREAWLHHLEAADNERLKQVFGDVGWSLRDLAWEVEARNREIQALPNLAARHLSTFMTRFAPWYARRRRGGSPVVPATTNLKELNSGRVASFIAALAAAGMGAYGVYAATQPRWDAAFLGVAVASLGIAGFVAAKGFNDVVAIPPRPEPPPPPADLTPALHRLRDANWVANQLYLRGTAQLQRLRTTLSGLGCPAAEPDPQAHFSGAVCDLLLRMNGIDLETEIGRFWSGLGDPVRVATSDIEELRAAVRAYAYARCSEFESMDANQFVTRLMQQPGVSRSVPLDDLLLGLHDDAAPRIVVEGFRSGSLAMVPRDLEAGIKEYMYARLGRPTLIESADPGRFAVLRYTQGYEAASTGFAGPG